MLGGLVHEPALTLATRLAALLPGDLNRVFFSESGSVAVEIAMKMAVQFWLNQGASGRSRFISFRHGYHGDTTGAMSVCDPDEGMHALFHGILPAQHVLELPRDEATFEAFERFLAGHADERGGGHPGAAGAGRGRHEIPFTGRPRPHRGPLQAL